MVATLTDKQIRYAGKKILLYRPLPTARAFHRSQAKTRIYTAGNRAGKSEAAIGYDLSAFALGVHPWRRAPRGEAIWAVAPTWDMVGAILWQEKLRDYLPAGQIVGGEPVWHNKSRNIPEVIHLRNGNWIEFKAFEQGRVAFQGRKIAAIYCDEQCEHDYEEILREMELRLIDPPQPGCVRSLTWTMTPVIPQALLEQRVTNPEPSDAVFRGSLHENRRSRGGHLADADVDAMIAKMPEEVQATRVEGYFGSFFGAVYQSFRREVHVIPPFEIPADWCRYRAIDWGFNNPFVCLWLAKDGNGRWYVYHEHYEAQRTLAYHAERIKAISGREKYRVTWADHDAQDRHEFKNLGILTLPAKKDVRLGIETVQAMLKVQADGKPRLFFFNTCKHAITEHIGYRWATGTETRDPKDEPEKKDDHTVDATRYCIYSVDGPSYFSGHDLS